MIIRGCQARPYELPGYWYLSKSKNMLSARRWIWRYDKKMSQTFFKRLILQDESWMHHYDPETKAQSMQQKHLDSLSPKKAKVQPSAGKVMLTVFWDHDRVAMTDFLAKGTTITGIYYASLLRKLRNCQNQEAGQDQRRYASPARQRSSPQHTCCQIRSTGMSLWNPLLSTLFSWSCILWLSPLLSHEVVFEKKVFLRWYSFDLRSHVKDESEYSTKIVLQICIKWCQNCVTLHDSYAEKD